jgi:hypothetical protein
MSLLITNQVIVDLNDSVIEPAAWRVAAKQDEDVCLALPPNFEREQDAERARAALQQAGLVSEKSLRLAGEEAVVRIMLESLAW